MEINKTWQLTNSNGNHIVNVCENDDSQAEKLTNYLLEGLQNNEAVVVIANRLLRKALLSKLNVKGLDVQALKDQGQIKFLEADHLLSSLLIDEGLDEEIFHEHIADPLESLRLKFGKVRVFGGMVAMLWQEGKHKAAIQLEDLWVNLTHKQEFSILCSYSLGFKHPSTFEESLHLISECHKHLIPNKKHESSVTSEESDVVKALEIAWNRMTEKFTHSQTPSIQLSSSNI